VFKALKTTIELKSTQVAFSSPSNIALIKYWGKHPVQLPANPSISFTLDKCKTETILSVKKASNLQKNFEIEVFVDGKANEDFKPKIIDFFERVEGYFSFLKDFKFKIETSNTFPHSSGIASSASGFSALAACLTKLEHMLADAKEDEFDWDKASFIARLGSGSASRSTQGPLMVWGNHEEVEGSSDQIAIKFDKVHSVFQDYQDVILLVDKGQKKVSSTVGHGLMNNHPYASARFKQAHDNMSKLLVALREGNLEEFIKITENEALSLHAMMMSSNPYFILMKPDTLHIIEHIWDFRKKTGIPVSFTLDAGANVHVLFPKDHITKVLELINTKLIRFCQNEHYICDNIGDGLKTLS
jgi:diphosphomevalonate decarboxylase